MRVFVTARFVPEEQKAFFQHEKSSFLHCKNVQSKKKERSFGGGRRKKRKSWSSEFEFLLINGFVVWMRGTDRSGRGK